MLFQIISVPMPEIGFWNHPPPGNSNFGLYYKHCNRQYTKGRDVLPRYLLSENYIFLDRCMFYKSVTPVVTGKKKI